MSKTQKYRVVSPLLHDGKGYQPGDEVALTEDEARPLLAANVVEAPASALEEAETDDGETEQSAVASETGQKAAQKSKKGGKGK